MRHSRTPRVQHPSACIAKIRGRAQLNNNPHGLCHGRGRATTSNRTRIGGAARLSLKGHDHDDLSTPHHDGSPAVRVRPSPRRSATPSECGCACRPDTARSPRSARGPTPTTSRRGPMPSPLGSADGWDWWEARSSLRNPRHGYRWMLPARRRPRASGSTRPGLHSSRRWMPRTSPSSRSRHRPHGCSTP